MKDATPPDLASALKAADLGEFFAECTDAHRREYLRWLGEAKRPETRATRIVKTVEMLAAKQAEEAARAAKKRR
ncbi:MAG TPA: YdeI/OmpD-associated family protein [Opitutaceae bacterium]|nr:YdeI/OmpD-associated family protein [Opitutaceae bacterium]